MSPDPPREVELKLELTPEDLPRLQRHRLFRTLTVGRASSRNLRSIYLDTPGLDLSAGGLTLRLRRSGRSWVQTVKLEAPASAGLFDRVEFECPVVGQKPDLSKVTDAGIRASLEAAIGEQPLLPAVETEVRRTRRLLRVDGTEIFADLDIGEVHARGERIPICELELELVQGDPEVLYDVAIELQSGLALRPSTQSKSDRGYASLTGAKPVPCKAKRVELPQDATLEDVLSAAVESALAQILSNEAPALDGSDVEGVHQMRVGVRRLRAAISFFKPVLPDESVDELRGELRWLADVLGQVRDLDVFLTETLAPLLRRFEPDLGLQALEKEALVARASKREELCEALVSPRFARLILLLGKWRTGRGWRNQPLTESAARLFAPASGEVGALLGRRDRKVRRKGRHLSSLPIEERHQLRVQLKKLRYAADFLRSFGPEKKTRRYLKSLAALQETLGHLNDVATCVGVLDHLVERIGPSAVPAHHRAVGFVAGWTARQAERRLCRSDKDWKAFAGAPPFWSKSPPK